MRALDIQVCYDRDEEATTLSQAVYLFWITIGGERMFGPVSRNVTTGDSLTAHAAIALRELLQAPPPTPLAAVGETDYTVNTTFDVRAQSAEQAVNFVRSAFEGAIPFPKYQVQGAMRKEVSD